VWRSPVARTVRDGEAGGSNPLTPTCLFSNESMKKILILFAHSSLASLSEHNDLVADLQNIDGITFFDIYQHYPDMKINVHEQQELLSKHDVIVFHHPLMWFSTPSILKEWQDVVLKRGWAFGQDGNALAGKIFFNTISTGGTQESYSVEGLHKATMRQVLIPIEKMAQFCKMTFLPPYVIRAIHPVYSDKVRYHRVDYNELLELLYNDKLDIQRAAKLDYLNDYFIKDKNRDKNRI
jgi:glutathione-regulated potassium-efflux system ancillary protein KefG